MKKPNCPHCLDKPLFGCVACPRPKSWERELLEEIELITNIALQTHEPTLKEESRKRYDALLKIRNKIARMLKK